MMHRVDFRAGDFLEEEVVALKRAIQNALSAAEDDAYRYELGHKSAPDLYPLPNPYQDKVDVMRSIWWKVNE